MSKYEYIYISKKKPVGDVELLGKILKEDFDKKLKIRAELSGKLKKTDLAKLLLNNNFQLQYLNELYSIFKKYFYKPRHFNLVKKLLTGGVNFDDIYEFPKKVGDLFQYNISSITEFYKYKYDMDPEFFNELRDFVVPSVGKGEYLFGLFTKCKNLIDSNRGDLMYGKTVIEIKGYRGKTRGNSYTRSGGDAQKEIENILYAYDILDDTVVKKLKINSISHTMFSSNPLLIENIINSKYKKIILEKIIHAFRLYNITYKISTKDIERFEYALRSQDKFKISAFLLSIHLTYYILNEYHKKDLMFILFKKSYDEFFFCKTSKGINRNFEIFKDLKITLAGWGETPQDNSFGIQLL